jgi:elongin-A
MVNEYRRDRLPTHTPVKILSRKRNLPGQFEGRMGGPSLEEREKRLRALTMSRGQASGMAEATLVSSEDDEDDDLGDLFDEKPRHASRPTSTISSRAALSPSSSSQTSTIRSQPRQLPTPSSSSSASNPAPRPKPSDVISSMISKPKPKPSPHTSATLTSSTPTAFSRSPSPSHGERNRMMVKKRPPPDVFNRAASKKLRAR